MPRKRTTDTPTTDTETQPAIETQTEAATATAEPSEAPEQTQSFVERLQQQERPAHGHQVRGQAQPGCP
jgi:hypothetical protein